MNHLGQDTSWAESVSKKSQTSLNTLLFILAFITHSTDSSQSQQRSSMTYLRYQSLWGGGQVSGHLPQYVILIVWPLSDQGFTAWRAPALMLELFVPFYLTVQTIAFNSQLSQLSRFITQELNSNI